MSDEDFVIRGIGPNQLTDEDDFERILEALIGIAQSEGRDFLAYLLRMALMEARNQNLPETYHPHSRTPRRNGSAARG
jgi:hypothetical protein